MTALMLTVRRPEQKKDRLLEAILAEKILDVRYIRKYYLYLQATIQTYQHGS